LASSREISHEARLSEFQGLQCGSLTAQSQGWQSESEGKMNFGLSNSPEQDSNPTEARLDHICESDARHRLRITDDPKNGSLLDRTHGHSPLKSLLRWIGRAKVSPSE
jgi:hypothetical protein